MKNALISGGAGGLGKAIALELLQSGHRVFAADLSNAAESFDSWKSTFKSENLHFVALDVTDYENCVAVVEQIESHGGVDVLVNAAGVTQDISLRKMDPAQWALETAIEEMEEYSALRRNRSAASSGRRRAAMH
jgi:acetoacetyl-CoA reductase